MKTYRVSKAQQAIYAPNTIPPIAPRARFVIRIIRIVGQASRLPSAPLPLKLSTAGEPPGRDGRSTALP